MRSLLEGEVGRYGEPALDFSIMGNTHTHTQTAYIPPITAVTDTISGV